jgi:hypothetical protein
MGEKIAASKKIKAADFEWYAASSHGDDAYAITIGGVGVALETGRIYCFKADVANTGAATLNINGLGAVAIKKNVSVALDDNDILAGKIIMVVYDGANFQMLGDFDNKGAQTITGIKNFTSGATIGAQAVNLQPKFGGTGADGALNISSGTTTVNLGGANYFVLNYTTISITGTAKLAFSNPAATGCIIVIKCQGNCVITSTQPGIDASGMGGQGGNGGTGSQNGSAGNQGIGIFDDLTTHFGGAGLKAGTPGAAGTVYVANTIQFYTRFAYQIIRFLRGVACGSGGGGGAGNSGGAAGVQNGGAGGSGGAGLILEVAGALNFTGYISVAGKDGGSAADIGLTNGNVFSGAGGGGGAGGFALVLYNSLTANSGTILSNGGAGGKGGNCNSNGAHGETGDSASGGGAGGADGGAGGIGGTYPGGNGGNAGGRRAGGGGGAGTTSQNQGAVAGGAGGSAGASENVLVVQNQLFT